MHLVQSLRESGFVSDLFDDYRVGDVVGLFVQLSKAQIGVILEINHKLCLNLQYLHPLPQLALPLLLPLFDHPIQKRQNFLIVNGLFNSRCFLELSLKSLLQLLTPIPEVHFKGSELREGGLIVGQAIPIHSFKIFVLHGLLQSYPFAHILTVHPPHQVPEGRTEQLRTKQQLSIARFGEDYVLRSPSEGRASHHQMV